MRKSKDTTFRQKDKPNARIRSPAAVKVAV